MSKNAKASIIAYAVVLASFGALASTLARAHTVPSPIPTIAVASPKADDLDPNDCSRGIDEANQEACSP